METTNLTAAAHASERMPDEARMASELRGGSPRALEAVYNFYRPLVLRMALRIVHDEAVSEDIVQETFACLWHHARKSNEGAAQIGPLVFTIARHRALDHIRARVARARLHENLGVEPLEPAAYPSPDKRLMTEETARLVMEAMDKLNANQRRVIEMAYFGGLSQSQIAGKLNQPLGTVKSWARSALSTLRMGIEDSSTTLRKTA